MAHWAKLSEDVGKDGKLAELAEKNPLAALLFTWSLAAADVYGIIPASIREYNARVCSALMKSADEIEQAIADQAEAGVIELYEADGGKYIYIRRYHRYQDIRWDRVGEPQHPLPGDWQTPAGLDKFLQDDRCTWADKIPNAPGVKPAKSNTTPGPLPDHSRTTPEKCALDVEVDVDVEENRKHTHHARACEDAEINDELITPSDAHTYAAHGLTAAVMNAQPAWAGRMSILNSFCRDVTAAICDKSDPDFTEASVFAALEKWPPRARDSGRDWLKRVAGAMWRENGKTDKPVESAEELANKRAKQRMSDIETACTLLEMHGDRLKVRQLLLEHPNNVIPAFVDKILDAAEQMRGERVSA